MRRSDLLIGILAGIVLGLAVVAVFVFVFSEETVDAPSLDEPARPAQQARWAGADAPRRRRDLQRACCAGR